MSWHKVILTSKDISSGKNVVLEDGFHDLWEAAGSPKGMALFCDLYPQPRTKGKVGMQMAYYFSPSSLQHTHYLFSDYSAAPCEKPHLTPRGEQGLRLFWGHPDAWTLLE